MTTNATTSAPPDVGSPLEQTLISCVFIAMSAPSFASCSLFFATILHSKELRTNGFFQVMFSLTFGDALCQLGYLVVAAPSSIAGAVYSDEVNIVISSIAVEIAWFHNSLLLVFQSINRLLSICYPDAYERVFGGRRVCAFIAVAWLVGVAMGSTTMAPCCHSIYFTDSYSFYYDLNLAGATTLSYIDLCYTMTNLSIATVVHAAIFVSIYRRHRSIDSGVAQEQFQEIRRRRETKLFLQLFVATTLLVVAEIAFIVVPILTTSRFGGFAASVINITAMSANSFIFLLFNKSVNEEARLLLREVADALGCKLAAASGVTAVTTIKLNQTRGRQTANNTGTAACTN